MVNGFYKILMRGAVPDFVFRCGVLMWPGGHPTRVDGGDTRKVGDSSRTLRCKKFLTAGTRISVIQKSQHTITELVRELVHQAVSSTHDLDQLGTRDSPA
jgi:hypothetical protein